MEYKTKLERMHKEAREGVASDYVIYQSIKQLFNAPKMTFYEFGLLKQIITGFLKRREL